jgi:hypothetical protein
MTSFAAIRSFVFTTDITSTVKLLLCSSQRLLSIRSSWPVSTPFVILCSPKASHWNVKLLCRSFVLLLCYLATRSSMCMSTWRLERSRNWPMSVRKNEGGASTLFERWVHSQENTSSNHLLLNSYNPRSLCSYQIWALGRNIVSTANVSQFLPYPRINIAPQLCTTRLTLPGSRRGCLTS